jgi:MFS family permease
MLKQKLTIFFIILLDVIGLGIILPTMPLIVNEYGASPLVASSLFGVFALFSFFSGPMLGALSDRLGRRPVLIVSLLGTAAGWAIFIFAFYFREYFLPIIFFARIVDGVTAGNIATAQSYLVDIARNDKERTTNLGLMGAAFGVGFVIGPALGGALSQIIPLMPFYFATALGLINALAAFLFLQETHHRRSTKKMTLNPFVPMIKVLKHHHMRFLFLIW